MTTRRTIMKNNYKKPIKATNAVAPAAPASVWGKGCAGKGGKTTNASLP